MTVYKAAWYRKMAGFFFFFFFFLSDELEAIMSNPGWSDGFVCFDERFHKLKPLSM